MCIHLQDTKTPTHTIVINVFGDVWTCLDHVTCSFKSSLHRSSVLILLWLLWCPFDFHAHISTTFKQTLQGSQRSSFWQYIHIHSTCQSHPFKHKGRHFAICVFRFGADPWIQNDSIWFSQTQRTSAGGAWQRNWIGSLDITPDAPRLRNIESLDLGGLVALSFLRLRRSEQHLFTSGVDLSSTFLGMPASGAWKRWLWLPRLRLENDVEACRSHPTCWHLFHCVIVSIRMPQNCAHLAFPLAEPRGQKQHYSESRDWRGGAGVAWDMSDMPWDFT